MSLISYVVDFFTPASVKKRRADAELRHDIYSILEAIRFLLGISIGSAKRDKHPVYGRWDEFHGQVGSCGLLTEVAPGVILVTHAAGSTLPKELLVDKLQQYALTSGFDGYTFQLSMQRGMHRLEGVPGEEVSGTVGYLIDESKFKAFIKRTPNKGLRVSALRAHLTDLLTIASRHNYRLPFGGWSPVIVNAADGVVSVTFFYSGSLPYCDDVATVKILGKSLVGAFPKYDVMPGSMSMADRTLTFKLHQTEPID